MNPIVPFTFPETGQHIRVIGDSANPLIHHGDVCRALEHTNPSVAINMVDPDERVKIDMRSIPAGQSALSFTYPTTGNAEAWFLTEAGFYSLAFASKAKGAQAFRRWVTHEVLPSIRKTGRYEVAPRALSNRELAELVIAEADRADAEERRAIEAESRVAELEPVAQAYDVIASAKGDFSLRDAAFVLNRDPGIDTGQNRLMETLRKFGMVDRRGVPYARHSAHLTERIRTYNHRETGEPTLAKPQIRITVAGLRYLHRRMGGVAPLRFDQLPLEGAA